MKNESKKLIIQLSVQIGVRKRGTFQKYTRVILYEILLLFT